MSRKKSRDIELFIVDIFVAIKKISIYIKPFSSEDDLRHSSLHWDATIRQLEVIGEALNNLLNDENFLALSPSYFRKIVNFRNTIIHGYFGIDTSEVWDVVTNKLSILETDLYQIVKENIFLQEAINSEIAEYKKLNDKEITRYLYTLKSELT